MKVELELDVAEVGPSVVDILQSLPASRREAIAEKVILAWLSDPSDPERIQHDKLMAERAAASRYFTVSDNGWKSKREQMLEKARDVVAVTFSDRVKAMVETDVSLLDWFEKVKRVLIAEFPAMLTSALSIWIGTLFGEALSKRGEPYGSAAQILANALMSRLREP